MNTTASTRIGGAGTIFLVAGGILFCSLSNAFIDSARAAEDQRQGSALGGGQDKNRQAADLLLRARQAMAENNLSTAESLIAQSEALGVEYGVFHRGDTPKKARKDLERKRGSALPTKPSQLFSPSAEGSKKVPVADPFTGRMNDAPAGLMTANPPSLGGVTPLPKVDVGNPMPSGADYAVAGQQWPSEQSYPSTQSAAAQPVKNESDIPAFFTRKPTDPAAAGVAVASGGTVGNPNGNLLLSARKKLALGDLRRANDLVQQAKTQNIQYGPLDDSPAKVENALRKMHELGAIDKSTDAYRGGYARNTMEQAEAMLRYGEFDEAERLANLAASQQVIYGPFEAKPVELMNKISAARRSGGVVAASGVVPAANYEVAPAGGVMDANRAVSRAIYNPLNDPTRNVQVQAASKGNTPPAPSLQPVSPRAGALLPPIVPPEAVPAPEGDANHRNGNPPAAAVGTSAQSLFQQGETALKAHDKDRAYQLFQQSATHANELDPATAQRLQNYLQMLGAPSQGPQNGGPPPTMLDETAARQQVLARQVAGDLAHQETNARAMLQSNPRGALEQLEEAKKKLENAGLEPGAREQLLRRVDRAIAETKQFIEDNRPQIDRAAKNERIRQEIDHKQKTKYENQEKVALLVDEYNRQIDEQRYEEAQVTAKKAAELYPKEPVVQQMLLMSKIIYRVKNNESLKSLKEEEFLQAMESVDKSSVPFDDRHPYVMPDAKEWDKLTKSRGKMLAREGRNLTEREIAIQKQLKMPVSLDFKDAPLSKVIDYLAKVSDVNIYLDPKGLNEEGIDTETPVNINVKSEIMLKSALNLILDPLHLSYVVKDEVLKITSEQMRDAQIYTHTYNVADLVIPIPNFVPIPMGLQASYDNAMTAVGYGGGAAGFSPTNSPLAVVADNDGKGGRSMINNKIMAQLSSASAAAAAGNGGRYGNGASGPVGYGPGGLGGGSQADFDPLIDMITSTINPTTWSDAGGPGSIKPFEYNLSIVVSQTQEAHEQIVDLLQQLRRMQDLQVTIEVRFITLNDNFFERIGVDFDFDIHDYNWGKTTAGFGSADNGAAQAPGVQAEPARNTVLSVRDKPATVGMTGPVGTTDPSSQFSSNLDIPFRQNSFGLAIPQFGGFDPSAGATMGFAILSDIEAYFFINAAQGDKRSNVLQAPKVTLFNGQQAFVADQSQTPFVTSVIPVVGDFAAAQQPVIVVLSEGTFMTVQAVVSQDRRFVRLTVVPFFSKIGEVKTFTFTGSDTTTIDTSRTGNQVNPTDATKQNNSSSVTHSGTTVQLPTFSYVSVTTTVSVPDGGTVLLGGIKRLSEGRSEFGVPMLSDLPYINRLFKNVSVGRETQSLMMMVTPRIIIQEEEESKLGINSGQ